MTIISASRRTDIPALYGDWFMDKIGKGGCLVANPFNGKVERVSLALEDVNGIVFWSRNYRPMLKRLRSLNDMGYRFYCQFTIIGYPRFIDPGSPAPDMSARTARMIRESFGTRAVVWRYDPIMLTSVTDAKWHARNFTSLLEKMEGATDTCVISFIDRYRKLERNLFPLLEKRGVTYYDPARDELENLAGQMALLAEKRGITVESCCEPKLSAVGKTSCVDPLRLSDVAEQDLSAVRKAPTRAGCRCAYSKDIGAYDTCVLGCAYCYANNSRKRSMANRRAIKKESPGLGRSEA